MQRKRKYIKANTHRLDTHTHMAHTHTDKLCATTMASSKFAAHQSYTKYALNKQNCRGGGARQGEVEGPRAGQGLSCRFCVVVLLLAVVVCCISLAACTCLYVCVCVCAFLSF